MNMNIFRVRACPVTIVNLLFANLEMGGGPKWQGDKLSSICVFYVRQC